MGTPGALIAAQGQDKLLAISEETVVNPVLGVGFSVKSSRLDVNVFVRSIKVNRLNGRCLVGQRRRALDRWEERRDDEVHVLCWVGEETHHRHGNESTHGSRIVVSRKSCWGGGKVLGDVIMSSASRLSWATGVVVLVDSKECRLVADVSNFFVVHVVETLDKG